MNAFIKRNSSDFKDQLQCEAKGLELLRSFKTSLSIPETYEVSEEEIRLEKVDSLPFDSKGWKKLGKGLARLHRQKARSFGLDHDNYIGLNPQINTEEDNWGLFFVKNRLGMQVDFITEPKLQGELREVLNAKSSILIDYLNVHKPHPSPIHGDLWSGNTLYDGKKAWLIDPAFYFGDREADLAMTEMFGRFGEEFYEAYDREYPLAKDHEGRKDIYNLYHYLNHYNIFGNSYLPAVKAGFNKITKL